mgnify:CR=1 FL=1
MLRLSEYGFRFFITAKDGVSYRRWRGGLQAGMGVRLEIFNGGSTFISFENKGVSTFHCKLFSSDHPDDKCCLSPIGVTPTPTAVVEIVSIIAGMSGLRAEVVYDETFTEKRIITLRFLKC